MMTQVKLEKKPTINDIARQAGVSKKTVSRVINNEPYVKQSTRSHIQNIIEQLHFSPDPQARGLAFQRSFLLAVIYDNPNHYYIANAMYGILDQCKPKGYELVVHPCDKDDGNMEDNVMEFINRLKIDGIILLPPLSESDILISILKESNCNYVRIVSFPADDNAHMVYSNDRKAMSLIADHIVELGHKKIAVIQGPDGHQSAQERFEGFQDALIQKAIKLPTNRIAKGSYTFQSGVECTEWLLNRPSPPTAIFAFNDEMAIGCIVAAEKMGLKIPTDLTVIGFDDSPRSAEMWPALTTVNQNVRKMCYLATEKLLYLCNKEPDSAAQIQTELIPEFIQRQSTALPRSEYL